MHVPDGFINAPVSAATGLISLGTIWAYIRNAKNLVADRSEDRRVGKVCSSLWSPSP